MKTARFLTNCKRFLDPLHLLNRQDEKTYQTNLCRLSSPKDQLGETHPPPIEWPEKPYLTREIAGIVKLYYRVNFRFNFLDFGP